VIAMVALAAAVVTTVGTVNASQTPTPEEQASAELGQNEAWVRQFTPEGTVVHQSPVEPGAMWVEGESTVGPSGEESFADVPAALPDGTALVEVASTYGLVTTPERAVRTTIFAGETWGESFAGLYDLTEGVAPTNEREALVSPLALDTLGLALGDEIEVEELGQSFTVVGVMTGPGESTDGLIFLPNAQLVDESGYNNVWYLPDTELTWEQIQELNTHGLLAYSRSVALDPPPWDDPDSAIALPVPSDVLGVAGIGLVAVLLLAGSAFTVSFRREQRQLALLAATGAGRASLVSVGVSRGLLLGLVGGVVGAVVGVAAGWGWVWLVDRFGLQEGTGVLWGYHWEPQHLAFAIAFGAFTGATSSLVPALIAARIDVLAALRGARKPSRPRRATPWWAGAFLLTGAVVSLLAARRSDAALDMVGAASQSAGDQGSKLMVAGFVLILAGLVMVTPRLLVRLSSVVAPWGVAARLAARDAARNAGRTVPVIAAIAVTMALATIVMIGVDRADTEAQTWETQAVPEGTSTVSIEQGEQGAATVERVLSVVETALPAANATVMETWPWDPDQEATMVPSLGIPDDKVCPAHVMGREGETTERQIAEDPHCQKGWGAWITQVAVGGPEQLEALLRAKPSDAALAALADGSVIALDDVLVEDGTGESSTVELQWWDYAAGEFPDASREPSRSEYLPAVVETPPDGFAPRYAAIMSPETAARIGYPVMPDAVLVDVDGGISADQVAELNRALIPVNGAWLSVQGRAHDGYDIQVMSMMLAAVLVAAGLSTAVALGLARADARRDDFTLAALGASPRLARSAAGWQAAIIVAVALGIGMVSGVASAWVESHSHVGADFSPPWMVMGAALVVVPALVAGLAWLFTKAPKTIHYRLAA
jgi:hypothetical protein